MKQGLSKYQLQKVGLTEESDIALLEIPVLSVIKVFQDFVGTFLHLSQVDIHSSPDVGQLGRCISWHGSGLRA